MLKVRKQGRTKVSGHLHVRALGLVQVLIWEDGASTLKIKKRPKCISGSQTHAEPWEMLPCASSSAFSCDLWLTARPLMGCRLHASAVSVSHTTRRGRRDKAFSGDFHTVSGREQKKMLLLMFDFSATDEPIRTCLIMTGILVLSAQHHCKPLAG